MSDPAPIHADAAGSASSEEEPRPRILQPCVYLSPDGNVEFEVRPSDRYGHGACEVELRREGRAVWRRELDRTPFDARVLDDGVVVGHSDDEGFLRFFVFDPEGGERACASVFQSYIVEGGSDPRPLGLVVREEPRSATLRLSRGGERHLRLDDGRELAFATGREVHWPVVRRARERVEPPRRPLELLQLGSARLTIDGARFERTSPRFLERGGLPIVIDGEFAHGFEMGGRHLWTLRVERALDRFPFQAFDVEAIGVMLAFGSRMDLRFDPQGRVLSRHPHGLRLLEHERFLPDGARWSWNRWRLVLQREGQPALQLERGADGLWFRELTLVLVAADGTMVLFDDGQDRSPGMTRDGWISHDGDPAGKLQVIAPDGRVQATLTLPEELAVHALAADAEVVALLAEPPTELWLVRLDGSFLGQAPLPFAPDARCAVSFSPDGRELLVLDPDGTLHRFELRWR